MTLYRAIVEVNNGNDLKTYHLEVKGIDPDDACCCIGLEFKGLVGVNLKPVEYKVRQLTVQEECGAM